LKIFQEYSWKKHWKIIGLKGGCGAH
jgi:hypothetical protein